jgi:glycosyltransferase involved in cell wall biosynthesis
MRILFLHSELMGYTESTLYALTRLGANILCVHWDHRKLTPYNPAFSSSASFLPRSTLSYKQLSSRCLEFEPEIAVVSGWMDKGYLNAAFRLKRKGVKIVCGFDDQWEGTLRQRIASLGVSTLIRALFFDYAWVTGAPQFEYARRLGFPKEKIIRDLYSCDFATFNANYRDSLSAKAKKYPHTLLFVGRFHPIKGIPRLLKAWDEVKDARGDWNLKLVGNGPLGIKADPSNNVIVQHFLQPDELAEAAAHAGCFILPSVKEPWGVVIHEFAASGLPLVTSSKCGANSEFLINNYNGFIFDSDSDSSLSQALRRLFRLSDEELFQMGANSARLAARITPETSANALLSIISGANSPRMFRVTGHA